MVEQESPLMRAHYTLITSTTAYLIEERMSNVKQRRRVMNRMIAKSWGVVVMGIILLFSQGCSTKWLQSGGENESGGANSNFTESSKSSSTSEVVSLSA